MKWRSTLVFVETLDELFIKKLTLGGGKNGFLNNGGCRKDEAQKEEKEVEGERRIKRRKP